MISYNTNHFIFRRLNNAPIAGYINFFFIFVKNFFSIGKMVQFR